MILIITDSDLYFPDTPLDEVVLTDLQLHVFDAAEHAQDVYLWRNGTPKALKRLNAPLITPHWMHGLTGVDL